VTASHCFLLALRWGFLLPRTGGSALQGLIAFVPLPMTTSCMGTHASLWKVGSFEPSGFASFGVGQFSPDLWLAAQGGAGLKYTLGALSLRAFPQVGIPVNHRSADNMDDFITPVEVAFQCWSLVAIVLDSGYYTTWQHFVDDRAVPIGIGTIFSMGPLDLGAEFMLRALFAGAAYPSEEKGRNNRTLAIFGGYRTQ
jgi:hypothetical protein